MANAKTYRPEELALELGLSGKIVRSYLRATFPRPAEAKNSAWVLTNEQAKATREHFMKKRSPVKPAANANAKPKAAPKPKANANAKRVTSKSA